MYLRTEDLTKRFGGVVAADGVTLGVARGEVLGLVGPNGAGKSTLLQMLDGVVAPDAGRITLDGAAVQGWSPQRLAAAGVGRTFQTARVFPGLTVWESVMVGAYTGVLHEDRDLTTALTVRDMVGSALGLRGVRARKRRAAERAEQALTRFGDRLWPRREELSYSLSYANRRRLEIARVLASRPRLLLLDEPTAGMNPTETAELTGVLADVHAADPELTVVLVEHKMSVVREISRRVVVLDAGRVIADGTPDHALADPAVVAAYLGTGA